MGSKKVRSELFIYLIDLPATEETLKGLFYIPWHSKVTMPAIAPSMEQTGGPTACCSFARKLEKMVLEQSELVCS